MCLKFEIEHKVKPGSNGLLYQYKENITINLNELVSENYALTIELSPKWNVDVHLTISSTNVSKLKQESVTFETFVRRYINFEKTNDHSFITFEIKFDLKHDIPLNFNNYWEKAYIVLYGCRDLTGDATAFQTIFDKPLYFDEDYNILYFTQNVDFHFEYVLRGLKTPTVNGEAATKAYVDTNLDTFNKKIIVLVLTTSPYLTALLILPHRHFLNLVI